MWKEFVKDRRPHSRTTDNLLGAVVGAGMKKEIEVQEAVFEVLEAASMLLLAL